MNKGLKIPTWCDDLEMGYGFARTSGWCGIGITYYDPKDYTVVWFVDDFQCNSEEEFWENEFIRMNILEEMNQIAGEEYE